MREYGRLGEDGKTWWGREEQGTTIRDRDNPFHVWYIVHFYTMY
jgi:hypothetical protein